MLKRQHVGKKVKGHPNLEVYVLGEKPAPKIFKGDSREWEVSLLMCSGTSSVSLELHLEWRELGWGECTLLCFEG